MFLRKILFLLMFASMYVPCISAGTAIADTLVQPDTSVVKTDTSVQDDNDVTETIAEDFGNRLKSQLNLADDQTDRVKSIISSYAKGDTDEEAQSSASEEIVKWLNDTQRGGWESVKDSFWSDLNRRIKEDNDHEKHE